MRRVAVAFLSVASVGFALGWLLALVPVFPLTLVEHFRVQLSLAGAVLAAASIGAREPYADAALVATALTWLLAAPELCASRRALPDGVHVRVLMLNVQTESSSFAEVRRLIADVDPDVVGLVEMDRRWIDGVAAALGGYAGRIEAPRGDNFGVALYTRAPLTGGAETLGIELPTAVASVDGLSIVLTHPPPPISSAYLDGHRAEMAAVAARVRSLSGPVIVLGDFNATPWSRPYRSFLAATGLCDSRAGFGLQATFPSYFWPARIPLDHLWASCVLGVASRRVERDVGSDHLPIVVDLVVPR